MIPQHNKRNCFSVSRRTGLTGVLSHHHRQLYINIKPYLISGCGPTWTTAPQEETGTASENLWLLLLCDDTWTATQTWALQLGIVGRHLKKDQLGNMVR